MITRNRLLLVLLAASCTTAFARSEEIVQRHLSAGPGGKLLVDVDFGTVDVTSGSDNEAVVNGRRVVDVSDQSQEKEFLAAAPITVSQEGNTITVRSRSNRQWHWNHQHIQMDAHYTVQLPKNFNVDLRTSGGSIGVKQLNGELKADTAGGSLNLQAVHGPINARTSGGQVKLADCEGLVKVRTNGGNIDSTGGSGSLNAQTSGGAVSIRNFAGSVETTSNGGRMDFEDIDGSLNARTAGGAIAATVTNPNDVSLETNAGAISLAIPSSGGFKIDASTSIGGVHTDLPVTIERKHDGILVGDLNGGGKSVHLRTSAGSISIKALPPKTAAVSSQ
ncbi:MAG: DUF4097 family beta strand repeat-containing protein [Chthoniobacterales bacterium]